MSNSILNAESTLTDRFQTTVPAEIRKVLNLGKRSKIEYHVLANGSVVLSRAKSQKEVDPAIDSFLTFIANDISENPGNVKALSSALASRIQSLVGDVEIDLNEPLSDEDE